MTRAELINQINTKRTFLCVGLDSDITKIPKHLLGADDAQFEFNKQLIDATHQFCVAYKPNTAFYESIGTKGWQSLEKTIDYLHTNYPNHFTIADAKRGDIGNTSQLYAKAFLENLNFDSVTVAPYMGEDSVKPFLTYKNKWVIVLALTSNIGADDFQFSKIYNENPLEKEIPLYHKILKRSSNWGTPENMMYVAGATRPEMLAEIRKIVPNHFLLVPGIGAQGGSLSDVVKYGMNKDCGLLVNASRSIIFASNSFDFAEKAKEEAHRMQKEMSEFLD